MDKKTKLSEEYYLGEKRSIVGFVVIVILLFLMSANLSPGVDIDIVTAVEKTVNQTSAEIGEQIAYTINVTNTGTYSLYNLTVKDILPPGFAFNCNQLYSSDTQVTCTYYNTGGDNYIIINKVGGLIVAGGTSYTANILVNITSNAAKGSNVNKVEVDAASWDGIPYIETDEATMTVKKAELLIEKYALNATATPQDTIQYTIVVKNIGTGKAKNVKVFDDLPGTDWLYKAVPTSGGCISVTPTQTNTFTFNIPDLNGSDAYTGSTCEFTYSVDVPYPDDIGLYTNTATVTGDDTAGVKLTNDTDTSSVYLTDGNAELVVNKEVVNYREYEPMDVIEYRIEVSNRGYKQIRDITVVDSLPIGLAYNNSDYDTYCPYNVYQGKGGNYTTGTNITWSLFFELPGKSTCYIYLNATVMSNAPDGTNLNKVDGNGTKMDGVIVEFKDVAAAIIKRPKIEIKKSSNISVGYIEPGDYAEFTIKVKNPGTGTLYNVAVTDTMQNGWVYISENGDCDLASGSGNLITFDCGNISSGGTKAIKYTAYVNDNVQEGTNLNIANATGFDLAGANYKANDTISLMVYIPRLEIVKSASIYDVEPGSSVVFTITVENPTYATAYNVKVTDILPVGFEYISGTSMLDGVVISPSSSPPAYSEGAPQQNVTWNFGNIPAKAIKILTFETHVRCAVKNGTFTNNATTNGTTGNGALKQNSTYINMAGWKATATIFKSVDDSTPTYYQYLKYTVVIRNRLNVGEYEGANMLPRVVTDVLPKGLKFVNGSAKLGGAGEISLTGIQTITGDYTLPGGTTVKWNFTENAILLKPGEFTVITYIAQVMPGIASYAPNTVNMTYLDPVPTGIPYCTDCEFSTGDINTIYPELTGVSDGTTYTIPLNAGWNLISIPLAPVDVSIDSVLKSIEGKYTKVFAYEDGWKYVTYADGEKSGSLDKIEAGKGYWLYMLEAADLELTGNKILSAEINLNEGWSLIGWLSTDQKDVSEALASIDGSYGKVFTYNAGSGWSYRTLNDGTWHGDLTDMEPGKGYWLFTSTANTLVVNN